MRRLRGPDGHGRPRPRRPGRAAPPRADGTGTGAASAGRSHPAASRSAAPGPRAFDDLVLDAVEDVEAAVADDAALVARLAGVELGVEDVPPADALERGRRRRRAPAGPGRTEAAPPAGPARLVLYRRPIELRGPDPAERGDLVHDVVVEQLAELLDVPVDRLDPPPD